jgi:calcium-dependent protein kinase
MDDEEKKMLFNEINILRELVSAVLSSASAQSQLSDTHIFTRTTQILSRCTSILKTTRDITSSQSKCLSLTVRICKGGELFDEIIARGKFTEKDAAVLVKQILSCINYCHKNKIVHRDLKPENVLLEQNKDFDQIKIIDFGTSLVHTGQGHLDEKLGTPYYIAPEVLNKKYNEKCDLWSIGVITYIILSGMPPFNGNTDQEIMKKVKQGKFSFSDPCWSSISDKAKDFITQLFIYDIDKRPSAEQALQHAWITEMSQLTVDTAQAQTALTNLKGFSADQKLKQATFAFIATQLLSKSEKEQLAKVFKEIDTNGDGVLSLEEVLLGYDKFFGKAKDQEDIIKMFKSVDTDNSGFIDYTEFVIASMDEKTLLSNDKL